VLLIGGKARPHRVRPAEPLKPGRDLAVIQVWVIAALAADELKRIGVAAFYPARHDAGRPAPQGRRAAVAGPTRRRERREILVVTARRRVTGIVRSARYGNASPTIRGPDAGGDAGVSRAHGAHLPAVVVIFCRGLEQHDNPQFSRMTAFKQHMQCIPGASAGRSRRPARCTLATCRARNPAAAPATAGPHRQLTRGPDTGK
jgi:hypothetical protein